MKTLKSIAIAAVALLGMYICIAEHADILGLPQYAFNIIYICCILPGCISLSGIIGKLRPDLENTEE